MNTMHSRRQFILRLGTLGICIASLALLTHFGQVLLQASQQPKVLRIGFLGEGVSALATDLPAFRRGLREQGYVEGQTIIIEPRYAEAQPARLSSLADELVQINVDVIVATGSPASQAAKKATGTIPIVALAIGDPVGTGLVASLARP